MAEKEGYCRKRQVTRSVLRWKFNASVLHKARKANGFLRMCAKMFSPSIHRKEKSTTRVLFSLAEKEGFEPSLRFYPYYSLSRGAP